MRGNLRLLVDNIPEDSFHQRHQELLEACQGASQLDDESTRPTATIMDSESETIERTVSEG